MRVEWYKKWNLALASKKLETLQTKTKILLIHSNFEHLQEKLIEYNIDSITGIYYDLWVSSMHFDEAERWFSLRLDGPLDMRFDTRSWKTAADILNYYEEKDLFEIFKQYGEEPHARKIAINILKPWWDIFVISFHSLEDRIVKQVFKRETRDCICSDIICTCHHKKSLLLQNKKPILPWEIEQKENSRSRSAKARHAKKI